MSINVNLGISPSKFGRIQGTIKKQVTDFATPMFSFFKDREDSSDKTLSRLSSEWTREKVNFKYKTEEESSVKLKNTDIHSESMFPESIFDNGDRTDVADKTLSRLSSQWSDNKKMPTVEIEKQKDLSQCDPLTALETQDDGVSFHRIDEEVAPSFLVDWKLWGIKIAIFIVIPMSIVWGGGAKHISKISPMFGEFCHNQTLFIQETIFGRDSEKVADNHYELAELYFKKKEFKKALDHAHSASKIYVFHCLNSMYEEQKRYGGFSQARATYKSLKPEIGKLRDSLILLARSSNAAGYDHMANKYWLMALSIEPDVYNHNIEPMPLIKIRLEAAQSLARKGHNSDAKKCYTDAFKLLSLEDIQGLYSGYPSSFNERTLQELRYLIFLHQKRAEFLTSIKSSSAYDDLKTSEILQKHLLHFIAKKELDRNWVPENPFMGRVDVSFKLAKGYIRKIKTYNSLVDGDAKAVEKCIFKTLNRSKIWKDNDTAFNALSINNINRATVNLQFRLRATLINQTFYKQVESTPLYRSKRPGLYSDRDIKQNIVEISKSL